MAFHVRVTLTRDESVKVSKQIVEYFKPKQYIVGYEEKGDNKHMHMHIEFDEPEDAAYLVSAAGKSYKAAYFKKIGYAGKYYFKECTDPYANKLYVAKDLDIICHNYEEEEYDEIINATTKINENKKMDQKDKLLEAFREEFKDVPKYVQKPDDLDEIMILNDERPHKLSDIADWIHWHYINKYNKAPPAPHLMREYMIWIASLEKVMDTKAYYYNMFKD